MTAASPSSSSTRVSCRDACASRRESYADVREMSDASRARDGQDTSPWYEREEAFSRLVPPVSDAWHVLRDVSSG